MSLSSIKLQWRQELLSRRKAILPHHLQVGSQQIGEQVTRHPAFLKAQTIHCFLSLPGEVATRFIIESAWMVHKQVVVPIIHPGSHLLTHSPLHRWDDLEIGPFQVLQPKLSAQQWIDPQTIDLVLVPGLGFNLWGYRLGYGKGYYDRFLQESSGLFLGLAFQWQIIESSFQEPHDIPVHQIITEQELIEIKTDEGFNGFNPCPSTD